MLNNRDSTEKTFSKSICKMPFLCCFLKMIPPELKPICYDCRNTIKDCDYVNDKDCPKICNFAKEKKKSKLLKSLEHCNRIPQL